MARRYHFAAFGTVDAVAAAVAAEVSNHCNVVVGVHLCRCAVVRVSALESTKWNLEEGNTLNIILPKLYLDSTQIRFYLDTYSVASAYWPVLVFSVTLYVVADSAH